jgi:tRNA nucleotidyltransferase (CCA-adding enzyme)
MALPLAAASWDELVDPHGGRQALAERRLSVLHDRSFRDDPTRILRGVELGARLGLRFDAGTEALARADGVFFEALSPSRLAEAWARLFPDTQALGAKLTALGALGLGWLLGGGFEGLQAKDVARLEAALAGPDGPRGIVERAVLAWLARRGGAAVEHALARRFGRPQLVGLGERLDEAAAALTLDLPPHLLEAAVAGLGEIELVVLAATAEQRAADRAELVRGQWRRLRLAIAGADLLAAGWPAGPRIGEALRRTRRARLDGEIEQSEELKFALAWLQGGEGSG